MLRLSVLVWILVGTVLAGCLVTVVLLVPAWAKGAMLMIPVAGALGYALGIPVAVVIARKLIGLTDHHPA